MRRTAGLREIARDPAGASIALPLASLVQMEPISMRVAAMMRAAAGVYKIPSRHARYQPSLRLYQKTRFGSIGRAGQPPAGTPDRRVKWELSRVNPGDDPTLRKGGRHHG